MSRRVQCNPASRRLRYGICFSGNKLSEEKFGFPDAMRLQALDSRGRRSESEKLLDF